MKMESLVSDVTAVGSPDRAERAILGVILAGRLLVNSACICDWKPLCDVGSLS